MKQIKDKYLLAILVMMGAMLVGCTTEEDYLGEEKPVDTENHIVTLTTAIGLGDTSETRALTKQGEKTFAVGDEVAVVYWDAIPSRHIAISQKLTADDIKEGGKKALITVSLTNPKVGEQENVRFVYPAALADRSSYDGINMDMLKTGQDGTLDHVGQWDVSTATASMTVADNVATLTTDISLQNPLSILRLAVKDNNSTTLNGQITEFDVTAGRYNYNVKRTASTDSIYLVVKPVTNEKITTTFKKGDDYYSKTVSKTLEANKIYPVSLMLEKINPREIPLTFKATQSGQIEFDIKCDRPLRYKKNGVESDDYWIYPHFMRLDVYAGDEISLYGNNEVYYDINYTNWSYVHSKIGCTVPFFIYGNIMSLCNGLKSIVEDNDEGFSDAYKTADQVYDESFQNLFLDNHNIISHALPLVLPATHLGEACYRSMFYGCYGLTKAPDLPATTLEPSCYREMFARCYNLTKAPALPATEMKAHCYRMMFSECEKIPEAPLLPATKLASSCYCYMFDRCYSLKKAPNLPVTTLADGCYTAMFFGCTGLTEAPALPATTLAYECYWSMFEGCTNLTKGPDLLAPTLTTRCYDKMFKDCAKLSSITCLATSITAENCLLSWLDGVAENGTFTKAAAMNDWPVGVSGIPENWTVNNQ